MPTKSLLDDEVPTPPQKPKPTAARPPQQRPPPVQRPVPAPAPQPRPRPQAPSQQPLPPPPSYPEADTSSPEGTQGPDDFVELPQGTTEQQEAPAEQYPEEQAPAYTPPPRQSSPDGRLYTQYQQSKAATQAGSYRRSENYDESRRAAVEAYRRRKQQQGLPTPQYGSVRVARRADGQPAKTYEEAEQESIKRRFARSKDKWGVVKGVVVIVVLLILFMLPITQTFLPQARDVLMSNLTEPAPRLFPESAEYTMQRSFGLDVKSGTVTYDLKVPVPYDVEGAQQIIAFTPAPVGVKNGNDMTWHGDSDAPIAIIVTYHFKATTVKWSVTPETSGTPKDVPASYQKYLGDEWEITPSNPDIQALAKKIVGDKDTVYEKLDALAAWMRNNIIYEKDRSWKPKTPLETLSSGTGDCDDQSILFASLARAQGVPAWLEMGALYDEVTNQWGGHAWLKAYIPLRAGGGLKINMDPANKEFLVRDPYRLTEWESDGNGDDLQNYYTLWQFSYQGTADYDASATYTNVEYKRSSATVTDKPAGSGLQDWQNSYKIPGFETLALVPALGVAMLIVRRRLKNR